MIVDILYVLLGMVIGGIGGFFIARFYILKYMKKNPPINEQMIRSMMKQKGRTPSQKKIKQIMKSMMKKM